MMGEYCVQIPVYEKRKVHRTYYIIVTAGSWYDSLKECKNQVQCHFTTV